MKISKIFALFLAFLLLNSIISISFILKASSNDKKLSNYVCKITKDIIKSKSDTQDVLIGNLGGKMWSSTVNDIAGCVGSDNSVVVSDFKAVLTEKTLRKSAVSILAIGHAERKQFRRIIIGHIGSTVWHHMAKILFLVNHSTDADFFITKDLIFFGFQHFAFALEQDNHLSILTLGTLNGHALNLDENHTDIFPDKLNNLHQYGYRVAVCNQYPRIKIRNRTMDSRLLYFLDAVAKVQNARLRILYLSSCNELFMYWNELLMDITLNTAIEIHAPSIPKLLTYEESGHCALVPLPPKVPLFHSIFIKPFDGLTWMFLFITMLCSVAVFWMFRGRGAVDSPWLLGYGMFVMFIGQGVDFSRKNRLMLTILLQLIIVMIWILSNAYEGVITSFMIQPIQENRLETFEQLVSSDYEIIADQAFFYSVNETAAFEKLKPRLTITLFQKWESLRILMQKLKKVVILECDQIELIMTFQMPNGENVSDHYYMLPKKLSSYIIRLEASYFNPFIERLQHYMDLSFQAGLLHIWDVFMTQKGFKEIPSHHNDEPSYLKLEDLSQVFSILIIGYVLSSVLFLIEIFFHDVLKKLELANLARRLRNRVNQMAYKKRKQPRHPEYQKGALYYIIHRRKRVKRLKSKKLKVRRIYVQPRFPVD